MGAHRFLQTSHQLDLIMLLENASLALSCIQKAAPKAKVAHTVICVDLGSAEGSVRKQTVSRFKCKSDLSFSFCSPALCMYRLLLTTFLRVWIHTVVRNSRGREFSMSSCSLLLAL